MAKKNMEMMVAEDLANVIDEVKKSQRAWSRSGMIIVAATLAGNVLILESDGERKMIHNASMDDLYRAMGVLSKRSPCYQSEFHYITTSPSKVIIQQLPEKIGSRTLINWERVSRP